MGGTRVSGDRASHAPKRQWSSATAEMKHRARRYRGRRPCQQLDALADSKNNAQVGDLRQRPERGGKRARQLDGGQTPARTRPEPHEQAVTVQQRSLQAVECASRNETTPTAAIPRTMAGAVGRHTREQHCHAQGCEPSHRPDRGRQRTHDLGRTQPPGYEGTSGAHT